MPRQNTAHADCPAPILAQIQALAAHIAATRKARGESQTCWAQQLGISQPTMARLERGDPSIATATYLACLCLVRPGLDLCQLLQAPVGTAALSAPAAAPAVRAAQPPAAPAPSAADALADLLASFVPIH